MVSRETTSIVTPMIQTDDYVIHPLKELESQGEMPVLKSVGLARISPMSKNYISYVITSQGSKVLNIEVAEPDARSICEDTAKMSFVNTFLNEDGPI